MSEQVAEPEHHADALAAISRRVSALESEEKEGTEAILGSMNKAAWLSAFVSSFAVALVFVGARWLWNRFKAAKETAP